MKLEGSDHAPVYASLLRIPNVPRHNTPPLSARYIPMIYGVQQTLGTISFSSFVDYALFHVYSFIMLCYLAE